MKKIVMMCMTLVMSAMLLVAAPVKAESFLMDLNVSGGCDEHSNINSKRGAKLTETVCDRAAADRCSRTKNGKPRYKTVSCWWKKDVGGQIERVKKDYNCPCSSSASTVSLF